MTAKSAPFISICIPAFQRTHYLRRLLQSISEQTYTDFEVILSDDSKDDSVKELAKQFEDKFTLSYYRNQPALGTPANWNYSIGKAKGEWIKLMHDDDWFSTPAALQAFAEAAKGGKKFLFSAYENYYDGTQNKIVVWLTGYWKKNIKQNPSLLIVKNVIGPPSVTMLHRSINVTYDERLKWRVDTDFYERVLSKEKDFGYIPLPLICVGISESQVTQSCLYKPEIELPEGLILLEKYGVSSLQNVWVYDAWWRLFRNMNIVSKKQLYSYTKKEWPNVIYLMVEDLSKAPAKLLQTGIFSKLFMSYSYFKNRNKI